eukprot:GFYU01016802.1.p1 GENE.GFYU01016802.1~~GFYU01016802.1.p1  ORF type:complete len:242 (-),score=50.84 GFYU01016802.1:167-892(-)
MYIWYASYNCMLDPEYFSRVIQGGVLPGLDAPWKGCASKSFGGASHTVKLPFRLFFAQMHPTWGNGLGFLASAKHEIDLPPMESQADYSYASLHLVSEDQFADICRMENHGVEIADEAFDFEELKRRGEMTVLDSGWYGHLLYCGELEGHPIIATTCPPWHLAPTTAFTQASPQYVKLMCQGLMGKSVSKLGPKGLENSGKEIVKSHTIAFYLTHAAGMAGKYNTDAIRKIAEGRDREFIT